MCCVTQGNWHRGQRGWILPKKRGCLLQYLVTLAVSDGFRGSEFSRSRATTSFSSLSDEEWNWCLDFIVRGGNSLEGYEDFHKVVEDDGYFKVLSRKVSMRHKFNIGTIVSSAMIKVKLQKGKYLGQVEEYFISKLIPGDALVCWKVPRTGSA